MHDHAARVRGYLWALVGDGHVADDLVQEVFRRAWAARDRYRESGQARAYLMRIADRLACDHHRRRRREVQLDEAAWTAAEPSANNAEPSAALLQAEARRQLASALAELAPLQQRVLLMRYYGELPFADIAAALDCPLNTVLSHTHRGLLALRRILTPSAP
jgi:RNA polymerase sigma-70 factor (ECF subfamily)